MKIRFGAAGATSIFVAALLVFSTSIGVIPSRGVEDSAVLTPIDDTYTMPESPDWNVGEKSILRASSYPLINSTIWLKFSLDSLPEDATVERARLILTTAWSSRESIEVLAAPTDWDESMTFATVVSARGFLAAGEVEAETVSADVTGAVRKAGKGEVAFAIPPDTGDRISFAVYSSESSSPPRLELGLGPATEPGSGSGGTDPGSGSGGSDPGSGSGGSDPGSGSGGSDPGSGSGGSSGGSSGGTLFGASLYRVGTSFTQALASADARYGDLEVVRVFYPGAPAAWPGIAGEPNRPVVVSFKYPPQEILSGEHDDYLRSWFAAAPKNRTIWWSLYHEPEDNIASGAFTAAQYRSAWQRVAGLADQAGNPKLRATLILMQWSLDPRSGREWTDYYPGGSVIDVLGFDVYNSSSSYTDPAKLLSRIAQAGAAAGKPVGIGEFGSVLQPGDASGHLRAAWLKAFAAEAENLGAEFVCYWDSVIGAYDVRLTDAPSQQAWRSVVSG